MSGFVEVSTCLKHVFESSGRGRVAHDEFVRVLAFNRAWLRPRLVRLMLTAATDEGLLVRAGTSDLLPSADLAVVRVPIGFRPSGEKIEAELAALGGPKAKAEVPLFRRIVRRVAVATEESDAEVVAAVNRAQASAGGLLTAEAAGLLVARRQGVDVADLIDEALRALEVKTRKT